MKKETIIVSGGNTKLEDASSWKEFIKQLDKELANIPVAKTDNYVCVSSDAFVQVQLGGKFFLIVRKESYNCEIQGL
jgi:hypothetical protein